MPIKNQKKIVGVIGLGPVGLTWSTYLIKQGWNVLGYDTDNERVELLKQGRLPIEESGLGEILFSEKRPHRAFQINPTTGSASTWFICAGLIQTDEIGNIISAMDFAIEHGGQVLFIRTTLPLPALSSMQEKIIALRKAGVTVAYFPEFMREGAALEDIEKHDVFLGHEESLAADLLSEILPNKVVHSLGIGEAMLLKLSCNAFHALKVTFINEIADVASHFHLDGMAVSKAFKQDRRLNISPAYLTPGAPFGGSCLGKDLAFLISDGAEKKLLSAIQESNQNHKNRIFSQILEIPGQNFLLLGDSFKPGTSDTRKSIPRELMSVLEENGKSVTMVNSFEDLDLALKKNQDVILLGTLAPTPSIIESLIKSEAHIYDLQFHSDFKVALSSNPTYRAVFP